MQTQDLYRTGRQFHLLQFVSHSLSACSILGQFYAVNDVLSPPILSLQTMFSSSESLSICKQEFYFIIQASIFKNILQAFHDISATSSFFLQKRNTISRPFRKFEGQQLKIKKFQLCMLEEEYCLITIKSVL